MLLVGSEQVFLVEHEDRTLCDLGQRHVGIGISGGADRRKEQDIGDDALVVLAEFEQKPLHFTGYQVLFVFISHL